MLRVERVLVYEGKKGGNLGEPFRLFYQGIFQKLKKVLAHWI